MGLKPNHHCRVLPGNRLAEKKESDQLLTPLVSYAISFFTQLFNWNWRPLTCHSTHLGSHMGLKPKHHWIVLMRQQTSWQKKNHSHCSFGWWVMPFPFFAQLFNGNWQPLICHSAHLPPTWDWNPTTIAKTSRGNRLTDKKRIRVITHPWLILHWRKV